MRQIMQFVLSGLGIAFSTKWLDLMTQTETPSRRYVRRLKTQPTKSTSGSEALKEKTMGRLLDPDWSQFSYVPAAKTDLKESMERYRRMVRGEGQGLHHQAKDTRVDSTNHAQVSSEPILRLQSRKLAVIGRKD
jgi:hypothetical protein